jgi:septal ring factor EnvC (AmiA/AmiB activator)
VGQGGKTHKTDPVHKPRKIGSDGSPLAFCSAALKQKDELTENKVEAALQDAELQPRILTPTSSQDKFLWLICHVSLITAFVYSAALKQKDNELHDKEVEVARRDAELMALRKEREDLAVKAAEATKKVAELDVQAAESSKRIAEMDKELASAFKKVSDLDGELRF